MANITLKQLQAAYWELSFRPLNDEVANVCLPLLEMEIKRRENAGRPKGATGRKEQNRKAQKRFRDRKRLGKSRVGKNEQPPTMAD